MSSREIKKRKKREETEGRGVGMVGGDRGGSFICDTTMRGGEGRRGINKISVLFFFATMFRFLLLYSNKLELNEHELLSEFRLSQSGGNQDNFTSGLMGGVGARLR